MIDFEELIAINNEGEKIAKRLLRADGYSVRDVTCTREFFYKHIDFIATKENETITLDVKWHTMEENRLLFIEDIYDVYWGTKGWLQTSQADYIWFGDKESKVFYIFSLNELRAFITKNRKKLGYGKTHHKLTQSSGYLVPIDWLSREINIKVVDCNG